MLDFDMCSLYDSKEVTAEEEQFVNEEVKLLALAQNLAPADESNYSIPFISSVLMICETEPKVLQVLIPCLIHLLQPQLHPSLPNIHNISLQLITHLAAVSALDFKNVVATIPPEDKLVSFIQCSRCVSSMFDASRN